MAGKSARGTRVHRVRPVSADRKRRRVFPRPPRVSVGGSPCSPGWTSKWYCHCCGGEWHDEQVRPEAAAETSLDNNYAPAHSMMGRGSSTSGFRCMVGLSKGRRRSRASSGWCNRVRVRRTGGQWGGFAGRMQARFSGGPRDGELRNLGRRAQRLVYPRKLDNGGLVDDVYELRARIDGPSRAGYVVYEYAGERSRPGGESPVTYSRRPWWRRFPFLAGLAGAQSDELIRMSVTRTRPP
jgi:hypothetical protein